VRKKEAVNKGARTKGLPPDIGEVDVRGKVSRLTKSESPSGGRVKRGELVSDKRRRFCLALLRRFLLQGLGGRAAATQEERKERWRGGCKQPDKKDQRLAARFEETSHRLCLSHPPGKRKIKKRSSSPPAAIQKGFNDRKPFLEGGYTSFFRAKKKKSYRGRGQCLVNNKNGKLEGPRGANQIREKERGSEEVQKKTLWAHRCPKAGGGH